MRDASNRPCHVVQGTSTACILALEDSKLHAANVGDSGFIVVRQQKVVFKSPSQQHRFNFPYQLGCPGTMSDTPEHAEVHIHSSRRMLRQDTGFSMTSKGTIAWLDCLALHRLAFAFHLALLCPALLCFALLCCVLSIATWWCYLHHVSLDAATCTIRP